MLHSILFPYFFTPTSLCFFNSLFPCLGGQPHPQKDQEWHSKTNSRSICFAHAEKQYLKVNCSYMPFFNIHCLTTGTNKKLLILPLPVPGTTSTFWLLKHCWSFAAQWSTIFSLFAQAFETVLTSLLICQTLKQCCNYVSCNILM